MQRLLVSLQSLAEKLYPPALPADRPVVRPFPMQPLPAGRVFRILVAEDAPSQSRLVSAYLRRAGYEVSIAETGRDAVSRVGRGGIDLVLMDVQMPALDGLAATRLIRRLPPPAGLVPIIAVTSETATADRKRCLSTGMTGFLAKPVNRRQLLAAVEATLADAGHGAAA